MQWARGRQFDLALSSNVYSHVLACSALRVPLVNLYDYDPNPANHIAFRLARKVIVPQAFPDAALERYGAHPGKRYKYPGIKEEVYLRDFHPTPEFRARHGLSAESVVVVMRPPSDWSPYHRGPNLLFDSLLEHAARQESTVVIFLPRIRDQADKVRALDIANVRIPDRAWYGPDLIFHADVVISAGGTMNREAAVLGTPVYTVYAGELGATDRHLIALGRLTHIRTFHDVEQISFEKRPPAEPLIRHELVGDIANLILA
jgi:predicted glycosyltransferase